MYTEHKYKDIYCRDVLSGCLELGPCGIQADNRWHPPQRNKLQGFRAALKATDGVFDIQTTFGGFTKNNIITSTEVASRENRKFTWSYLLNDE